MVYDDGISEVECVAEGTTNILPCHKGLLYCSQFSSLNLHIQNVEKGPFLKNNETE